MSISLQKTCKVDSTVLHSVYEKLTPELRGSQEQRVGFHRLRHDFNLLVKNCADNVKVTLYISDVVIVICAGKMENEIVITIRYDGYTDINWQKKTWSKYFNDGLDEMKQIPKHLFSQLGDYVAQNPLRVVGASLFVASCFIGNQTRAGLIRRASKFLLSL